MKQRTELFLMLWIIVSQKKDKSPFLHRLLPLLRWQTFVPFAGQPQGECRIMLLTRGFSLSKAWLGFTSKEHLSIRFRYFPVRRPKTCPTGSVRYFSRVQYQLYTVFIFSQLPMLYQKLSCVKPVGGWMCLFVGHFINIVFMCFFVLCFKLFKQSYFMVISEYQ